jgi:hypothetical protein
MPLRPPASRSAPIPATTEAPRVLQPQSNASRVPSTSSPPALISVKSRRSSQRPAHAVRGWVTQLEAGEQADEQVVLAELNRHRAAHGTAPARLITSTSSLQNALQFVNQNKENNLVALNGVIQETAGQTNHETSGSVVETTDPKLLSFRLRVARQRDARRRNRRHALQGARCGLGAVRHSVRDRRPRCPDQNGETPEQPARALRVAR